MQYVRPSDEDLFRSYNTDLKKRSLEDGPRRAKEFDDYVNKLKEWSKSDKSSCVLSLLFLYPVQPGLVLTRIESHMYSLGSGTRASGAGTFATQYTTGFF